MPMILSILSQYVSSIPERVRVYRTVRDQEVTIMQAVADTLQQQTKPARRSSRAQHSQWADGAALCGHGHAARRSGIY